MSNDIFDVKRFGNYFAHTIRSEYKPMLLSLLAIFSAWMATIVVPLLLGGHDYRYNHSSSYGLEDPMWNYIDEMFIFFMFIFLPVSASLAFKNFSKKEGRISSLMLPASHLEKYLTRWIIYVPLAMGLFLATFELADLVRCSIAMLKYPHAQCIHPFLSSANTDFYHSSFMGERIFSLLFSLQGIYFLGSIIWPNNSVLKTTGAAFVIVAAFVIYAIWLGNELCKPDMCYGWGIVDNNTNIAYSILLFSNVALSVICYVIAYFRYKEIEIIQRW